MNRFWIAPIAFAMCVLLIGTVFAFGPEGSDEEAVAEAEAYDSNLSVIGEMLDSGRLNLPVPTTAPAITTTITPVQGDDMPEVWEEVDSEPAKVTTTTTQPPATTTTVPQPPEALEFNVPQGAIISEALGHPVCNTDESAGPKECLTWSRADELDKPTSGYEALKGGAALFTSSWYDGDYRHEDLGLPCANGLVAIGAHATTANDHIDAPFGKLQQLVTGDTVTIATAWGATCTYEVTNPCPEGQEDELGCAPKVLELFKMFEQKAQTERDTLYLFTCDTGRRIFVRLELKEVMYN